MKYWRNGILIRDTSQGEPAEIQTLDEMKKEVERRLPCCAGKLAGKETVIKERVENASDIGSGEET